MSTEGNTDSTRQHRKGISSYFCFQIVCSYTMTGQIVLLFGSLSKRGGIQISKVSSFALTPDIFKMLRCDAERKNINFCCRYFYEYKGVNVLNKGQDMKLYLSALKIQVISFSSFPLNSISKIKTQKYI